MSEFIIVFREVLEASLVVGIIYLILEKSNQLSHMFQLWMGVLAAIVASIIVGYLVLMAKDSLWEMIQQQLYLREHFYT